MDAFSDPEVDTVVMMMASQTGKTEIANNVVGYFIDQDPSPMLVVQPTLDIGKTWSKDRFAPMLRDTPCLRGIIREARSRDSGNTTMHKSFPGGHITITGANAPGGLAARPIRVVICDEVDRFPASAGTEGDPVSLAFRRTSTFWNRKKILMSTPTIKGVSRIEAAYEESDRRKYWVPCPHCDEYQILKFTQVKWPKGKPVEAYYACEHCGCVLTDGDKITMIRGGEWRAEGEFHGVAGFWISALYSPWVRWRDLADEFIVAKDAAKNGNIERLKAFINTVLAETWQERGEAPDWQKVADLRLPYRTGDIPSGVRVLTCGADVHKRYIVYVVRGWGAASESWLIEYGEIWGETDTPEPWLKLAALLDRKYDDEYIINTLMIDSGYRPDMVYDLARKHPGRILATKGQQIQDKPLKAAQLDINNRTGRSVKKGTILWHIWTHHFKGWIHGRINWPEGEPGGWHLCADATDDYCKQIVAESLITASNGKQIWKEDGPNHYFDCEVLNAAAAFKLNVHLMGSMGAGAGTRTRRRVMSGGVN